ncbi:DNA2 [Sanghuangporus weigelae]
MRGKPSAQDESAFMEDLLLGIDSSFFDTALSPDPTPKKRKRTFCEPPESQNTSTQSTVDFGAAHTPTKKKSRPSDTLGGADLVALFEGAENWDWDDAFSPVRKRPISNVSLTPPGEEETYIRCVVESVEQCGSTKTLHVYAEDKSNRKTIVLLDDWVETAVNTGDILNIIGSFSPKDNTIVISSKHNMLVQHPDILVTATSIANALHCPRRSLLSLMVHSSSDKTPSLIWGSMLHEIMQRCLSTQRWDVSSIESFIDESIQKNLMEFVQIDVGVDEAKIEISKRAGGLKVFGERFLGETPKPNATLSNTRDVQGATARLAITRLLDVEEEIWSPKHGLKGKIDASLQVRIDEIAEPDRANHRSRESTPCTTVANMPLEIKTGRAAPSMEHRAQTMLYSVLMDERHGSKLAESAFDSPLRFTKGGLLFYTQSEEIIRVPAGRNELRGLIITRNELANYLTRGLRMKTGSAPDNRQKGDASSFLPPTINQDRACSRCYVADVCMLYRKAVEDVQDTSSPIADLYELKTSHLSKEQIVFFKHWESLIALEEKDMTKFRKELWTLNADEREKMGRCLANMVLDTAFVDQNVNVVKQIHRYTYRFVRQRCSYEADSNPQNLLHGHIASGDPVIISVSGDPRLFALARGFVLELSPKHIVVGVDHSLSLDHVRTGGSFRGSGFEPVFRIDKDELMGGMGRVRDNLARLFYATGSRRLLQSVVDLKPPEFVADADIPIRCGSNPLNEEQIRAVEHVLQARDYALILGMPGTGKTTTVAHMIRMMVEMGKTVLLTSYTHSAVDTILLKLKNLASFEILRLGNKDKVHPDVRGFTLGAQEHAATVEQLEKQLLSSPVVAATALSTDHALFSRRRFDYCIVDEASQITLPTCIGPLRFAEKFVLVGDHFQLPPLVKNKEARKGGFDVSLFRRLSDAHPHAVVDLTYQYRMNEDIMLLSNKLIYSGRLKCSSLEVSKRSLHIPNVRRDDCHCGKEGSTCWLNVIMNESCKAIFVDTDGVPAFDSRVGDLIQNEKEAALVQQLTLALLGGGVREDQIGIISLYRQQIKLLSNLLQEYKGIELLTADRSQGRDKDCIIISLVRANKDNQIGDLLKDWRRINVAFTRAQAKLVIFGSRRTLKASPLLSDFFEFMEERGWVLTLSTGADAMHSEVEAEVALKMTSGSKPPSAKMLHSQEKQGHPKEAKQASITAGILRSRPILRDILNDTK